MHQEDKKMLAQLTALLSRHLLKNTTVILGLSGGPDSMCALHALTHVPCTIIAAHLDHSLRPQSPHDLDVIAPYLEKHPEIILKTKKLDISAIAARRKKGIEETGRKERYRFFTYLAKKYQAKYIITGHHASDNLETILFNFLRGSGVGGLAGMKILDPPLFRPLLTLTKEQILDFLTRNNIPYVHDHTNLDPRYTRNALRLEIIPELKKINPNLTATITKHAAIFQEIEDYLQTNAEKWLKIHQKGHAIAAPTFKRAHPALQRAILRTLHNRLTGTLHGLEAVHIGEALTLIHANIGNKQKKMGALRLILKKNTIHLEKITKKVQY